MGLSITMRVGEVLHVGERSIRLVATWHGRDATFDVGYPGHVAVAVGGEISLGLSRVILRRTGTRIGRGRRVTLLIEAPTDVPVWREKGRCKSA